MFSFLRFELRFHYFLILFCICTSFTVAYGQSLPNSLWKIKYASSEEPINSLPSGSAKMVIDGDKSTFWHSQYSGNKATNPHEIQIDLGALALISEVDLVPRQKSSSGRCAEYELSVSIDGNHWTRAKRSSLFWSGNGDFSDKSIVLAHHFKAKFISYKHLKSFNNGSVDTTVASLADIKVNGRYISPVVIANFDFINTKQCYLAGEEIQVRNLSKAYLSSFKNIKWKCPGAEILQNSKNSITLRYNKCGIYDINLQVSNYQGFTSAKILNKKICILPGNCLDRRKWNIVSVSDEDAVLKGAVRNIIDSVPETAWCTTWDQLKPLPHYVTFDLGETTEINGFGYLPRQVKEIIGLVTAWKFFVSDNGKDWGQAISSGVWTYENRELKMVSVGKTSCRFVKFQIEKSLPMHGDFASCAEFYVYGNTVKNETNYLALLLAGLLIYLLFILYKRKKPTLVPSSKDAIILPGASALKSELIALNKPVQINLFGDFRVMAENKDISRQFPSKIKQLFIMLICFPEGISIHKMTALIWPGMPADKAVNNRSSIIKNLKTVLAGVSGITLEYSNKEWKMVFDKSVYCDLYEFNKLVPYLSATKDTNLISHICSFVERGLFLQDMDAEWLDEIKEKMVGEIIESFSALLINSDTSWNPNLLLQISECILIFDEVNEFAIKTKVATLISQQKNSVAKISFDNFVKKYQLFYNEEYSQSFSTFLD